MVVSWSLSHHRRAWEAAARGTGRLRPAQDIQDKQLSQNSRNKEAGLPRT